MEDREINLYQVADATDRRALEACLKNISPKKPRQDRIVKHKAKWSGNYTIFQGRDYDGNYIYLVRVKGILKTSSFDVPVNNLALLTRAENHSLIFTAVPSTISCIGEALMWLDEQGSWLKGFNPDGAQPPRDPR